MTPNKTNSTSSKKVKAGFVAQGPSASPSNVIGTRDESLIQDSVKRTLLKDLTDQDFVMETPTAAIFTLVVGQYRAHSRRRI